MSDLFETSERSARPGVEPYPGDERGVGAVPVALTPSAQSEAVEAAQEWPVVGPPPAQHAAEPVGQRHLGDGDPALVEDAGRTRTPGVERDQPEMPPSIDTAWILCEQTFEQVASPAMLTGPMQLGGIDDRIAVPVIGLDTGDDLVHLEGRSQAGVDHLLPQRMQIVTRPAPVLLGRVPPAPLVQSQGLGHLDVH